MDTSRYRAFIQAVDKGTLSKAAKSLSYTPSGVSQLISALERDLGFSVLERTAHGVAPTVEGERILPIARAVVAEEDRLVQMASEVKGLATGRVVLGSYPSVATHWLPQVLKQFHAQFPAIEIRIMEGIHQEVTEWLDNKEVDLAFISQDVTMPYDWVPLANDPMIAILPANHPYAKSAWYPVKECNNEDFIMPGKGQDVDTTAVLSRHKLHPNVVYKTIETSATLGLIEAGMGMTIMNSLGAQKFDFNVAMVPLDPPQSIILGIAVPSLENCAPATRHFIELAAAKLQQDTASIEL